MSSKAPRIAVFGTRWLGAEVLTRLHGLGFELALLTASAEDRTVAAAEALGVPWEAKPDPVPLMASDLPWRPDLIVCAHSFRIVPGWAIRWALLGAIGYHPSLLPAFKGRNAVADAVAAGVRETGGTVYWLTESVDAGPPVEVSVNGVSKALQRRVHVLEGETPAALWRRALAPVGAEMLVEGVVAGCGALRALTPLTRKRVLAARRVENRN